MGAGSSQVGSLRTANKAYDERRAAFEAIRIMDLKTLLGAEQDFKRKHFRRERFPFVTWPLADISMEKKETTRVCERSATKGAYFSDL